MKMLITTFLFSLLSCLTLHASNIEDGFLALIDNDIVLLEIEEDTKLNIMKKTQYNQSDNCITMQFQKTLDKIQVFNDEGEIEMMFPVSSTKVNLGLSLFESGTYKLGFIMEGESKIHYANISVN